MNALKVPIRKMNSRRVVDHSNLEKVYKTRQNNLEKVSSRVKKSVEKRKKIYAVDFDGTISFGRYPNIGKPNTELIESLKLLRSSGCKIILWTTREGQPLSEAVDFCASYGLEFDAVNDNLPELKEIFGNPRKVAADLYISAKSFPWWSNGEKGDLCKLLQNI